MKFRTQGAIELASAPTAGTLVGQGATEYLVLLAVVLIVALVSVALLGFFPGMASDSQRVQSEAYWRSASPIAMPEWGARGYLYSTETYVYLRVKNNGAYPVRLTGIVAPDGGVVTRFYGIGTACGFDAGGRAYNISDYFYLAPGEERDFGWVAGFGVACDRRLVFVSGATSASYTIGGASSTCQNSSVSPGTAQLSSMGFEYIEYIEGQQITKRQIGKQVIVRCLAPAT